MYSLSSDVLKDFICAVLDRVWLLCYAVCAHHRRVLEVHRQIETLAFLRPTSPVLTLTQYNWPACLDYYHSPSILLSITQSQLQPLFDTLSTCCALLFILFDVPSKLRHHPTTTRDSPASRREEASLGAFRLGISGARKRWWKRSQALLRGSSHSMSSM